MTITSIDNLVTAFNSPQLAAINKATIATQVAGGWTSLWRATGQPAQGASPTTVAVYTSANTGSLLALVNATDPAQNYIGRMTMACGNAGTEIEVHDRLTANGNLSGTVTTAQTFSAVLTTPAASGRCAVDGSDVMWWLEWYTATGATGVTATVAYTDQTDTARTSPAITIPVSTAASRMIPIVPNPGQSIKSVTGVTLSGTTATAGAFGVTATKFLTSVPSLVANYTTIADWAALALPMVADSSCLMLVAQCTTTSSGTVAGTVRIVTG